MIHDPNENGGASQEHNHISLVHDDIMRLGLTSKGCFSPYVRARWG